MRNTRQARTTRLRTRSPVRATDTSPTNRSKTKIPPHRRATLSLRGRKTARRGSPNPERQYATPPLPRQLSTIAEPCSSPEQHDGIRTTHLDHGYRQMSQSHDPAIDIGRQPTTRPRHLTIPFDSDESSTSTSPERNPRLQRIPTGILPLFRLLTEAVVTSRYKAPPHHVHHPRVITTAYDFCDPTSTRVSTRSQPAKILTGTHRICGPTRITSALPYDDNNQNSTPTFATSIRTERFQVP